ncbi:MAG: M48 family metallopeptidase [Vampirovibrionales bacterium]
MVYPLLDLLNIPPAGPTTLMLDGVAVAITEIKGRRQASAQWHQDGTTVVVAMPAQWPLMEKARIARQLARRLLRQREVDQHRMKVLDHDAGPQIAHLTAEELEAFVREVNEDTLGARIQGVRIGKAKKTRLAQINLMNRVITVSKYCLHRVPESALRYLIVHELCHTLEANHSRRFWGWVAHYHPTYRHDAKLIRLVHQRNVHCLE